MDCNNIMDKYDWKGGNCLAVMKFVQISLLTSLMIILSSCSTNYWVKDRTLKGHRAAVLHENSSSVARKAQYEHPQKELTAKPKTWSSRSENDQSKREAILKPTELSKNSKEVAQVHEVKWLAESKKAAEKKKRSKSKRRKKKESINRDLPVYGFVEKVRLGPEKLKVKAKLDSGAATSSLHAENIVEFERDGKKWIRFHVVNPKTKKLVEFERKLKRYAKVKQHERESQIRPVILMDVKLGDTHIQREFSLTNRENFLYQVLLGRNFLNGVALIDVSQTFLAKSGSSSSGPSK